MPILQQLQDTLGPEIVWTPEQAAQRKSSNWVNTTPLHCLALVLPRNAEELATALKICHAAKQPVVPHGGLTNVVGSVVTQAHEVAISMERMNQVETVDALNHTAVVQAGVVLQDLQDYLKPHGLFFPLDLGAKGSCMIGGNIATNAGGLQALRYGVTRNLVLGLEAVLADGTVISSLNSLAKNNAGYDLKQLFIGTEGTLGIITRAVLKLEDRPTSRNTAYLALDSFEAAIEMLNFAKKSFGNALTTFELFWQDYYQLMTSPDGPHRPPLPRDHAYYALLETTGYSPTFDQELFQDSLEKALVSGLIADACPAQSQQEYEWFWKIREQVDHVFTVHQPVFIFDVSLPISTMEGYIEEIKRDLQKIWPAVKVFTFGHMGDGNLHVYVTCGENDATTRHRVEEMVFEPLTKIGGSITAEHGVGLEKKAWLHLSRNSAELALMKTLKAALDPHGILNRGKVFD
jgi:FAD/FMN-containing dehydrogenase